MNKKGDTMCLTHIECGSKVLVHDLNAGHRFRHHMAEMGIFPGAMIKVLKKESQGHLLVQIGHSRMMLGRRMAEKITVK